MSLQDAYEHLLQQLPSFARRGDELLWGIPHRCKNNNMSLFHENASMFPAWHGQQDWRAADILASVALNLGLKPHPFFERQMKEQEHSLVENFKVPALAPLLARLLQEELRNAGKAGVIRLLPFADKLEVRPWDGLGPLAVCVKGKWKPPHNSSSVYELLGSEGVRMSALRGAPEMHELLCFPESWQAVSGGMKPRSRQT